jgi:CheY-like chemotaxis protein
VRARILIVDDEPFIRRILTHLLAGTGYEVESAEDGEQAWRRIQDGYRPDLIISDLMMPGMSGTDFVRRLRSGAGAVIPVLILTARGQEEDAEDARRAGADAFMTKPFSSHELLGIVSSLIAASGVEASDHSDREATGTDG